MGRYKVNASAVVEVLQPNSDGSDDVVARATFDWDVSKDWAIFVAEVTDDADKMLEHNDPYENAHVDMRFTTRDCKIYAKRESE